MYINDVVFVFSQGRIVSASIEDMTMISSLDLIDPTTIKDTEYNIMPIEEPMLID